MRRKLVLGDANVLSRRWAVWVNGLAASPVMSNRVRMWLYRRAGLRIGGGWVAPRCYFHTSWITIGTRTQINHGVHVENVAPVTIGDGVGIGVFALILTSHHEIGPPDHRTGEWRREPVTIEDGCWIGARSTILGGVTIGHGCVIAAGSLVRGDCAPNGLYAGVPARRIRDLEA